MDLPTLAAYGHYRLSRESNHALRVGPTPNSKSSGSLIVTSRCSQELRAVAASGRIRLFGTYDGIKNTLENYDQNFGTIEGLVNTGREQTFKEHQGLKEEMREDNVPPSDWVS